MSPLIGAPNRGYADYQRLENFDSGVLLRVATPIQNSQYTSAVLDMSRYAYLGGLMSCGTGGIGLVVITWWADAAATILLGERAFTMNNQMGNAAQLRLPNLGPFVIIQCNAIGAGTYQFNATVIGTNRVHPLEMIPLTSLLLDWNQSFPVGTTSVFHTSYYAGPALVTAVLPSSGVGISLSHSDSAGTPQQYDQLNVVTGAAVQRFITSVPEGICWANVINLSGSPQNVALYVIPTPTGAI